MSGVTLEKPVEVDTEREQLLRALEESDANEFGTTAKKSSMPQVEEPEQESVETEDKPSEEPEQPADDKSSEEEQTEQSKSGEKSQSKYARAKKNARSSQQNLA